MKTKIKVTKKHIKSGKPTRPRSCPIALAMSEALLKRVSVVYESAFVLKANSFKTEKQLNLPRSAVRFQANFDRQKSVKPFNFLVDI